MRALPAGGWRHRTFRPCRWQVPFFGSTFVSPCPDEEPGARTVGCASSSLTCTIGLLALAIMNSRPLAACATVSRLALRATPILTAAMRLSAHDRLAIQRATAEIAGPCARVYLFGSRTRDELRGGDIDLLVELPAV